MKTNKSLETFDNISRLIVVVCFLLGFLFNFLFIVCAIVLILMYFVLRGIVFYEE